MKLSRKTRAEAPAALENCPGCGAALSGSFCAACGEKRPTRLTFPSVAARLMERVRKLDFNIARTVVGLIKRPGQLIREYVHGRRATFTNPVGYALLCVTGYSLINGLWASELSRLFNPVLWFGWIAPYIAVPLMIPAAVLMRALFRKRDLTTAETYTFTLYTGGQIALGETIAVAIADLTGSSWPHYTVGVLGALYVSWAVSQFIGDRKPSTLLKGVAVFAGMAGLVVGILWALVAWVFWSFR